MPYTDHRAVVFKCNILPFPRGPSYYKFNNSLLKEKEFLELINNFFISETNRYADMDPHMRWETKKVKLKEEIIKYSKNRSIKHNDKSRQLENKINFLEKKFAENPLDEKIHKELEQCKFTLQIQIEEKCRGAAVRAKTKWIEEGEKNTAYFLGLEKSRKKQSIIREIKAESGTSTDVSDISLQIHGFYADLYSNKLNLDREILENFHSNIEVPQVEETDVLKLETPFDTNEVGSALCKLKNGSSPGLDSFTKKFYKTFFGNI